MRKLLLIFTMIAIPGGVSANPSFIDQQKAVLGQLLIMDVFKRTTEGKGILNPPVANLEQTLKDFQLMNPHKICYLSPQYHSDGSVTPRLKCH